MPKYCKVAINNQPLEVFLDEETNKEIDRVFHEHSLKYWRKKDVLKYPPCIIRHGKTKHYEDWEIFVYVLDNYAIDIADLDIDELSTLWKTWKKFRRI